MSNAASRKNVEPIEGFVPDTNGFTYKGVHYLFRELTVGENDECREAATDPKTDLVNSRTMMRMMIVAACVEPEGFDGDALTRLGSKLYSHVIDVVNELNDPDAFVSDEDKAKQGPEAKEPGNS